MGSAIYNLYTSMGTPYTARQSVLPRKLSRDIEFIYSVVHIGDSELYVGQRGTSDSMRLYLYTWYD